MRNIWYLFKKSQSDFCYRKGKKKRTLLVFQSDFSHPNDVMGVHSWCVHAARLQNGCKCSATPVAPCVLGQREMFSGSLKTMQIRPKKTQASPHGNEAFEILSACFQWNLMDLAGFDFQQNKRHVCLSFFQWLEHFSLNCKWEDSNCVHIDEASWNRPWTTEKDPWVIDTYEWMSSVHCYVFAVSRKLVSGLQPTTLRNPFSS